jgi:hypothetical protein
VLQSAIDDFARATGYRFDAEGIDLLPIDPIASLARAGGPMARFADVAEVMIGTEIRGRSERGEPLLLLTGPVQAFRSEQKIVFRRRIHGEWGPWTDLKSIADSEERMELRLLRFLAQLPAPAELLRDLGARTTSCQRTDPLKDSTDGGVATFECQIRPDAGWTLPMSGSNEASAKLASCTLRITVDHGQISRLELEGVAATDASSAFAIHLAAPAPIATPVVVRYRIRDVGATTVAVPDDAARLLGSR